MFRMVICLPRLGLVEGEIASGVGKRPGPSIETYYMGLQNYQYHFELFEVYDTYIRIHVCIYVYTDMYLC